MGLEEVRLLTAPGSPEGLVADNQTGNNLEL